MEMPIESTLEVNESKLLAAGTRRKIYRHPETADKIIKVFWDDQIPAKRRAQRWDRWFKSVRRFDDNENDYRQYLRVKRRFGKAIGCIYAIYGYADTPFGRGLVAEHVRNADGTTSETLVSYVQEHGPSRILPSLDTLFEELAKFHVVAKDPHAENIVVRELDGGKLELVLIDGLGDNNVIPFATISKALNRKKLMRKKLSLRRRILRMGEGG
ncbi:MAG: PhoP regulatory network YrbL family protein [Alphaproteobacteria bacterium]|nr:PhoP regulatory network YrbL family protein [Alphaproteobacteria bacterium]